MALRVAQTFHIQSIKYVIFVGVSHAVDTNGASLLTGRHYFTISILTFPTICLLWVLCLLIGNI